MRARPATSDVGTNGTRLARPVEPGEKTGHSRGLLETWYQRPLAEGLRPMARLTCLVWVRAAVRRYHDLGSGLQGPACALVRLNVVERRSNNWLQKVWPTPAAGWSEGFGRFGALTTPSIITSQAKVVKIDLVACIGRGK
jgi:hypothetical protein